MLGLFLGDPAIDGGLIIFTIAFAPPPATVAVDVGSTIKDMFAILTSAVTVIYLATHFSK